MTRKTSTLVGAGIGLALFLFVGLLPAMYYGGFAGVLLAGGMFGVPLRPGLLVRAIIYFSTAFGVIGVGALFAIGGAALGAVAGTILNAPVKKPVKATAK